jgi:hypothetical protein
MKRFRHICVLYTIIQGRKSYVAQTMSGSVMHKGMKVINLTSNLKLAKEFESEVEAEAFIPKIPNPVQRSFTASTETIDEMQSPARAVKETPG